MARLIEERQGPQVAGRTGGPKLQRLTFERPEWGRAAAGRRVGGVRGQGVLGIVIIEDSVRGEPPLVIKPVGADRPAESALAASILSQFGRKRGIAAPSQRLASGDEVGDILPILYRSTTGWVPDLQPAGGRLTKDQSTFLDMVQEQPPFVMGLAEGETLGAMARRQAGEELLADASYVRKLGVMTALDWFLGYADRISPDAVNLGNWMTAVDAKQQASIAVIDNFGLGGAQNLDERGHRSWMGYYAPLFKDLEGSAKQAVASLRYEYLFTRLGHAPQAGDDRILGPSAKMEKAFLEGLKIGRKQVIDKLAPRRFDKKRRGQVRDTFVLGAGTEGRDWALQRVEVLQKG